VYWIALAGIPGPYQAITKLISAYHDQPSPVRRIVPVGTGQVAILHEQESLVHVLNRHNHDMNDDATDTDYQLQSRIVTDEPLTGTCIQHTEHFTTLVGCTRSSLVFYDLRTAKPDPKTLAHTQPITNLTLSHSGSTIVTASPNNISVWTL
jgi:WD40 repeat protein